MNAIVASVLWVTAILGQADVLPSASPKDVGLSAEKLAALDEAMQAYIDEKKLAGILTIVAREGRVAHVGAQGMMDIEASKPMRRDAIFRIYSMTKPITTAALMTLYDEGKFDLDDPVEKYIPKLTGMKVFAGKEGNELRLVDMKRAITVRDLMRHTAGFAYGLQPIHPVEVLYRESNLLNRASNLDRLVEQLTELPLINQPGERWVYSVAVDVQGKLIEVLSGQRLDAFFQERIFEPLGMTDTGFFVPPSKIDRFTTNYGPDQAGGLKPIDAAYFSPFRVPPGLHSGGGGLISTADDYLRFSQMMLNRGELNGKRILKPETVDLMTQNQLPDELVPIRLGIVPLPKTGFGLGVAVRIGPGPGDPPGTTGEYFWGGAASTQFFVSPREKMIGIIMAQYMPIMREHGLEFRKLAYESITDSAASN